MKYIYLLLFSLGFSIYIIWNQNTKNKELLKFSLAVAKDLEKSNVNLSLKSKRLLIDLTDKSYSRTEEIGPYQKAAQSVKKLSDKLVNYLEELKCEQIRGAYSRPNYVLKCSDILNYDSESLKKINFFKNNSKSSFNKLKTIIDSTRINIFKLLFSSKGVAIDPQDSLSIASHNYLSTEFNENIYTSFQDANLEELTLIECSIILSKIQNESRNLETEVVEVLSKYIWYTRHHYPFSEAKILAKSNMVAVGNDYSAEIVAYSTDKKNIYNIKLEGKEIPIYHGKGVYKYTPKMPGVYRKKGELQFINNSELESYPFVIEFVAFDPYAVISTQSKAIMYADWDNPIILSIPKINDEDIVIETTSGNVLKIGSNWIARFQKEEDVTLKVFLRAKNGKLQKLAEKNFQVQER